MAVTISACILARNEQHRIEDALKSLQGWTEQILVIDNESEDGTVEVARRYGALILTAPRAANFDAARNLAIEPAIGEWVFYLDADERVPPRLGPELRRVLEERGHEFEALILPFKHYFCGKWMQHSGWWPGYTRPQLLKKGRFHYNERLHSGVTVDGRSAHFPADDPDLAIVHFSYDDLTHYLGKLNRYTDGEAESLLADRKSHAWQTQLAHFVHDWQQYYDRGRADLDGMHGFVLSFMSAFYRYASRAKLWDLRRKEAKGEKGSGGEGETGGWVAEPVPENVAEMLEFMAQVAREGAQPWLQAPHLPLSPSPLHPLPLLWKSPLLDPSGYADEARQFVAGLIEAGEPLALAPDRWGDAEAGVSDEFRAAIEAHSVPVDTPAELFVSHTLPGLQQPSATARFNIARTMFETDRLPGGLVERLAVMDRVWVPSEFNRETFVRSGIDPEKIAVVPGALDAAAYRDRRTTEGDVEIEGRWGDGARERESERARERGTLDLPGDEAFRFLTVLDWTLHKGWDVLLQAFVMEFGGDELTAENAEDAEPTRRKREREDKVNGHGGEGASPAGPSLSVRVTPSPLLPFSPSVGSASSASSAVNSSPPRSVGLILKVSSSRHYTLADIRAQAEKFLQDKFGKSLADYPNIHFWQETLPTAEMPRLYHKVDAFVLPTRGEGWCRPLMEAMAAGLPTIATHWSGLTAFHNERVGYPLKHRLMPVSEAGAEEIRIFAGQCWAEPDLAELRRLMRRIVEHPEAARAKGKLAQRWIARHFSRRAVTVILQKELAHCRELAAQKSARLEVAAVEQGAGVATNGKTRASVPDRSSSTPVVRPDGPGPLPMAPFLWPKANPLPRDPVPTVDLRKRLGRPLRVRWEGDQSLLSSLARVNREFCLGLLTAGDVELTLHERRIPWHTLTEADDPRFGALFARRDAPLSGPPDITIRHFFPPKWERPESGKLIVIQPWEYGHLPREWVEGARECADEVWAYSRFVRDIYVRSGVPAEKVRVVPLGFDPDVFKPGGPHLSLETSKSCRFLFVGGALERKGADLLLEAYRRAFTSADDVCLVVKDMGTRTFYRGQTLVEDFQRAAAEPNAAEILYLDQDLSDTQLAALYRACSCIVLPYRGEGFGLPPLEGMACGLLPIVTAGGATDDYLDEETGFRLPYHRLPAEGLQVGPFACVDNPWQMEPELSALADALRWVRDHPEEAAKRGVAARKLIGTDWTWGRAVVETRARLAELVAPAATTAGAPARLWAEPVQQSGRASERASGGGKDRRGKRRGKTKAQSPTSSVHPPISPSISTSPSALRARPEISLCMIVRDEEPRIRQCLKSIAPYVDEMILVDTGSKDKTREVARDCGARVFDFPWTDSFAEARNQSLAQARGEWLFWMDADDVISPACGEELRKLIRRFPLRDAAFQIQVRIPPGPKEFSETVVDHIKLFPNRPDLRFMHRIHEQILPAIRHAGLKVHLSDLYVTHQNYDRSKLGQVKKRIRDFRLLELDLRDLPEHPFVLFNLGMTYLHATKEYEVAAHYLQRSLDCSDPKDSIVRKAYAMLTTAGICQEDWASAIAANEEGRCHYPDDAELLHQAGQLYQQVGRWADGRRALERLIAGREDPHYRSVDVGLRSYRGWHELALLYSRMGDEPHCEQVLRDVLAANPGYLPAQADLVETLHTLGRRDEARTLLSRIPRAEGLRHELERLRELVEGSDGLIRR